MKHFHHGPLTHANVEAIAERIKNTLAGKLFTVAAVTTDHWADKIDLEVNQYLQCDWVDGGKQLVRWHINDGLATVHFCGQNYSYIYNSFKLDGGDHEGYKHTTFSFEGDECFRIKYKSPGSNDPTHRLLTFRVQGDLPWDTDEYHERVLRVHFEATGRPIPALV